MSPENALLIEKFLDGSITEAETQNFLLKVRSNEIPIATLNLASHLHGHLIAEFHPDKNNEILNQKIINKLKDQDSKLSDRIIKKIKTKKHTKTIWILAATVFLSILAGAILNSQMTITVDTPKHRGIQKQITINSTTKNETPHIQFYGLGDGSTLALYPNSILLRTKDHLFLEKGKLDATIKKQSSPLFFKTIDTNCQIIGTKFILQSYMQQNKPATELIVTEGLVEMNAFSNKEKVSNQKCLATSYDQKLKLSPLPKKEEMNDYLNNNIIYASHLENQIMEPFWQNWSINDRLLINPNKLTLFVDKNTKESFIQSQTFKTYLQITQYHFAIQPEIFSGSLEFIVVFSKKGAPYHYIGYVITKEAEELVVQKYEFNDGVRLNMEKLSYKDSIPKFIIEGPIANRRIPLDATDKSKFRVCKCALEDISVKILIKNLKDGEGYIDILKGLVVRADAKANPK